MSPCSMTITGWGRAQWDVKVSIFAHVQFEGLLEGVLVRL